MTSFCNTHTNIYIASLHLICRNEIHPFTTDQNLYITIHCLIVLYIWKTLIGFNTSYIQYLSMTVTVSIGLTSWMQSVCLVAVVQAFLFDTQTLMMSTVWHGSWTTSGTMSALKKCKRWWQRCKWGKMLKHGSWKDFNMILSHIQLRQLCIMFANMYAINTVGQLCTFSLDCFHKPEETPRWITYRTQLNE